MQKIHKRVRDMLATSGKVFIQKSQQGGGSPMIGVLLLIGLFIRWTVCE
ncbi:MAG: hypothetical protein R2777_04980 [Chitinophagales bacterium]